MQLRRRFSHFESACTNFARGAYDSQFLAVVRRSHLAALAHKESVTLREVRAGVGLSPSTPPLLLGKTDVSSKTLFILGCGSSINQLGRQHFVEMENGYSIGINAWVSHDFVPNAYSFEADRFSEPPSSELLEMSRALRDKVSVKPEIELFLLRPKRSDLMHRMVEIPPQSRDRAFMYGRVNFVSRSSKVLREDMGVVMRQRSARFGKEQVFLDNGASVVRMVGLGLVAGYEKIVLAGIDLNSNPNFWEGSDAPVQYRDMAKTYSRTPAPRHGTLETIERPFSTLSFLEAMASAAKEYFGATIFYASEGSALAGKIPKYPWAKQGLWVKN